LILADTSVWIDHLHSADQTMVELLGRDEVGCHPFVIEELALGSIRRRDDVLTLLANLTQFPVITHFEAMRLIDSARLSAKGLGAVDIHLLGSVVLAPGGKLWTGDRALAAAAKAQGVLFSG